jgi:hypothetical protein
VEAAGRSKGTKEELASFPTCMWPLLECHWPSWLWSVKCDPANFDLVLSLPGCPRKAHISHYFPLVPSQPTSHTLNTERKYGMYVGVVVCFVFHVLQRLQTRFHTRKHSRCVRKSMMKHLSKKKKKNRIENQTSYGLAMIIGSAC